MFCPFVQQVDHGMCNMGQLFSVCGEVLLPLPWLYGHRTEHSGRKARVCGLKLSLGSVIWWASLSTVAVGEKNIRHGIETNAQGWIGQSYSLCWAALVSACVYEWMHLGPRVLDCRGHVRNRCCKVKKKTLSFKQTSAWAVLTLLRKIDLYQLDVKKEQHE